MLSETLAQSHACSQVPVFTTTEILCILNYGVLDVVGIKPLCPCKGIHRRGRGTVYECLEAIIRLRWLGLS